MASIILKDFKKTRDGKYLKNYELYYTNKVGKDKTYEIVSYNDITDITQIGKSVNGVVLVALYNDKLLLLKEFRMGVNRFIYNLCAGRREEGESLEECAARELYEETGLKLTEVIEVLPPAYGSVTLSDAANQLAIVRVEGEMADHTEDDELIIPGFYDKEEVRKLIETASFSARAQFVAYSFVHGLFDV